MSVRSLLDYPATDAASHQWKQYFVSYIKKSFKTHYKRCNILQSHKEECGSISATPTAHSTAPGSWVQIKLSLVTVFFSLKQQKVRAWKSFRDARVGEVFHTVPQLLWERHSYRWCISAAKSPWTAERAFTQLTSQFSHCYENTQQEITE